MAIEKQNPASANNITPLSRAFKVAQMPGAIIDLTQPNAVRVSVEDPGKAMARELMEGAVEVRSASDDEGILTVESGVVGVDGGPADEVVHLHKRGADDIVRLAVDVPNQAPDQRAA